MTFSVTASLYPGTESFVQIWNSQAGINSEIATCDTAWMVPAASTAQNCLDDKKYHHDHVLLPKCTSVEVPIKHWEW